MPNMFKCTLASGGALILTVTCDSVFAGQTITCADGTTTLTQICPSTSPYSVEFRIPNSGTWTISSGTASTSVAIPDAIELHNIPNGSTVTPTDDIQTWLHCANIWDKSYTTISEALADSTTVTALIASNNAADYMARSTTWATDVCADSSAMTKIGANDYCADKLLDDSTWCTAICNSTYFESVLNVKVPTMTSNTTPSGECISSGIRDSRNENYYPFDSNDETTWASLDATTAYIGYIFPTATTVKKIVFAQDNYTTVDPTATLQYSGDGNNWSNSGVSFTVSSTTEYIRSVINSSKVRYWRIYLSYSSNVRFSASKLQFYGRA